MFHVGLLATRQDFAIPLAKAIETYYPSFRVDTLTPSDSKRKRTIQVLSDKYDLIQADELVANGVLGATVRTLFGTPLCVVLRGWTDYTNDHGEHGWIYDQSVRARAQCTLHNADAILTLSNVTVEKMRERYMFDDTKIVKRPIDTSKFQSGAPILPETEHRTVTVTNLRYRDKLRGIQTILAGLKPVFEDNPDFEYVIAGDGKYLGNLLELVENYQFKDRVSVLGYRSDIPNVLASADSFVYVSYLDSFGTVLLEAEAAGLPVLAGDAVGVPEAAGDAARLCDPTPAGVEEGMRALLSDDSYRESLVEASRERMETYNEEAAKQYVDVWEKLLHHSSRTSKDIPH